MAPEDALGHVEFAVLEAVNRGALRSRCSAAQALVRLLVRGGEAAELSGSPPQTVVCAR
jgi:hypothetical protein